MFYYVFCKNIYAAIPIDLCLIDYYRQDRNEASWASTISFIFNSG